MLLWICRKSTDFYQKWRATYRPQDAATRRKITWQNTVKWLDGDKMRETWH